MAFHINDATGQPGRCSAKKRPCPFGGPEAHFNSEAEARSAYEASQGGGTPEPLKKTIVLSDIDGTLVRSSLVLTNAVSLHQQGIMDLGDAPERWLRDMKNEDLVRELAETYREALSGQTVAFVRADDHIESLMASDSNFYGTLKRLIEHKANGDEVVLISGSPDFLVAPFAKKFGFKYFASTYHCDSEGRFTGEVTLMAGATAKEKVINTLDIHEYERVVGLGDTASDGPLLAAAHHSVLVEPTEETVEVLRERNIRIDEVVHD